MHKSKQHFYVTRESQRSKAPSSRKESYVGIRDLTDLDKIKETDIISHRGTIRGIKNRVRAGLANFENPAALQNVSIVSTTIVGGAHVAALEWLCSCERTATMALNSIAPGYTIYAMVESSTTCVHD